MRKPKTKKPKIEHKEEEKGETLGEATANQQQDLAANIYQNADSNIPLFVDTLFGEYRIRSSIERAIDYIEEKVKEDANKILSYVAFSKKLFQERSFKHAHSFLAEAMLKHKESSALIIEYGKLKFITQLYQEAADSFSAALKFKDIDHIQTLYNLGLSYLELSKYEESLKHFKSILSTVPEHVGAIINMGVAYKKLQKREEALKYYSQALTIEPDNHEIINNIGSLFYDQGNYEKAVEYFLKSLQLKDNDIETLSNLGSGLTKLKDYHTAWLAFEEALKLSPGNPKIVENYLLCLLEAKRFDAYDEMIEKYKYLPPAVKERVEAIADEYRIAMGIRTKKTKKKGMGNKLQSQASLAKSGASSVDLSKRDNASQKGGGLSSVEEEKE